MGLFSKKKSVIHKWEPGLKFFSLEEGIGLGWTPIRVLNDVHIGEVYQDNPNALDIVLKLMCDGRTVLNGDIIGMAVCDKKEVHYLSMLYIKLKEKFGRFYRKGNHEREGFDDDLCIIQMNNGKKYGFEHGDLLSDFDKWSKYRQKPKGAGGLKKLLGRFIDGLDEYKGNRPLPEGFIENAAAWCEQNGTDGLVVGHFHTKTERRYFYKGKWIIALPAHNLNVVWL